jgi:hypothetical protein
LTNASTGKTQTSKNAGFQVVNPQRITAKFAFGSWNEETQSYTPGALNGEHPPLVFDEPNLGDNPEELRNFMDYMDSGQTQRAITNNNIVCTGTKTIIFLGNPAGNLELTDDNLPWLAESVFNIMLHSVNTSAFFRRIGLFAVSNNFKTVTAKDSTSQGESEYLRELVEQINWEKKTVIKKIFKQSHDWLRGNDSNYEKKLKDLHSRIMSSWAKEVCSGLSLSTHKLRGHALRQIIAENLDQIVLKSERKCLDFFKDILSTEGEACLKRFQEINLASLETFAYQSHMTEEEKILFARKCYPKFGQERIATMLKIDRNKVRKHFSQEQHKPISEIAKEVDEIPLSEEKSGEEKQEEKINGKKHKIRRGNNKPNGLQPRPRTMRRDQESEA